MNTNDYTFYIGASYAISFVVLVIMIVWPLLQRRRILRELKRMQQRKTQLEKRRL